MKPKLALVDVNSKTGTQISSVSSDQSESNKIQRPAATREKGEHVASASLFVRFTI